MITRTFPVRGVPGGWRDVWDDPDYSAELRARAEAAERCLEQRAVREGERWRMEVRQDRTSGHKPD